jgi:hypothetical protein
LLADGQDVALWPGGERDSLRPWLQRDQAILAGRTGFIRLAIRSCVPIVPISTVGGPDSMPVLARGRRIAEVLQLDKLARLKMFPIALQAPWGISPALLPEIPLPTKIRTAFGEPVELDCDPERADDQGVRRFQIRRSVRADPGPDECPRPSPSASVARLTPAAGTGNPATGPPHQAWFLRQSPAGSERVACGAPRLWVYAPVARGIEASGACCTSTVVFCAGRRPDRGQWRVMLPHQLDGVAIELLELGLLPIWNQVGGLLVRA